MKKCILFVNIVCLFFSSIQGQNLIDSLNIDTIKLFQNTVIIKYPKNFHKMESSGEHGELFISYASKPPISVISIMVASNSRFDFGKDCIMTEKTESEHRHTEKGVCALRGYYRSDIHKRTRITISYESVSECEHSLFDYILDSVVVLKTP